MKKIFIYICILLFLWIGYNLVYSNMKTFDGSEKSLSKMMFTLPINEQADFFKDFELVYEALGGENKLIGFTVEDIRAEASNIKKWLNEQNILFLEGYIKKLSNSKQSNTYLHISNAGRMYEPQVGYVYKEIYSIDELKIILENIKKNN